MDLAKRKEEWLRYYAQYFPTVEINSTFYRPPNEFMVNGWIKKGQSLKGFEYSVKMPQQVTHETLAQGKSELARIHARSFEDLCVRPLSEENLLGSVIVQLSPSYKMTDTSISDLRALLASLSTDKYRYAIEFRDTSWLNGKKDALDDAVSEMMWEKNVANVMVDGPNFPSIDAPTADHAYIRLHGRTADLHSEEGITEESSLARHDYLYAEEELEEWRDRIEQMSTKMRSIRAYFNNSGKAKGIKNALQLMDMLNSFLTRRGM